MAERIHPPVSYTHLDVYKRQMYANVIVDISHEKLDKTFQYSIPDEILCDIRPGVCVDKMCIRDSFQPFIFFCKQKSPDILTGKFFRIITLIFQKVRNIVFIAVDGTFFEVVDFSSFLKLF